MKHRCYEEKSEEKNRVLAEICGKFDTVPRTKEKCIKMFYCNYFLLNTYKWL